VVSFVVGAGKVKGQARKLRVGIIFGGRSGEHEISLRSARSIADAIDPVRYDVTLIGIDRTGRWHVLDERTFKRLTDAALPSLDGTGTEVMLLPTPGGRDLIAPGTPAVSLGRIDVLFPVLHGTYGEDGTIQGLLELADIPYVGSGVLGSAVGMDKDVQKRLLQAAGIPVVPFLTATHRQWDVDAAAVTAAAGDIGLPLFVKPANLGSSVGITKVKTLDTLAAAVATALEYDNKVIIEQGINAREIECAVLGNDQPEASMPGEISPHAEFYSYEAKYIDASGATLRIPAPLTPTQSEAVRHLAVQAFLLLDCAGMARVDFFLDRDTDTLYVNELNTIPGFTTISMYPKLWEASGVSYTELIHRLIELALQRHAQRSRLKRTYMPSKDRDRQR
jgi:D-alanine-D-alanine ligase